MRHETVDGPSMKLHGDIPIFRNLGKPNDPIDFSFWHCNDATYKLSKACLGTSR